MRMRMRMRMKAHQPLLLLLLLLPLLVSCDDLQTECSPVLQKLTECLTFATGKSTAPSPTCCSSITDIHRSDPTCLCYIIQQVHGGGQGVDSLGIQIDRLIQLPAACKIANASATDCPKLLKLPPGSPDIAIFSNATKVPAASTTTGSANTNPKSEGGVNHCIESVFTIGVISAAFLFIF